MAALVRVMAWRWTGDKSLSQAMLVCFADAYMRHSSSICSINQIQYLCFPRIFSKSRVDITHWGRVTHICVSKLTIIVPDNGLSPGRRQAIIWTDDGILLIGPLGTKFSEIWSKIPTFSFNKMYLKTSSAKWRPFCLGLNVLIRGGCPYSFIR